MEDFRDSWVIDDSLEWVVDGPEYLRLRGNILCQFGYSIHVDKLIRVKPDGLAKAQDYSYQAMWKQGGKERRIFRYDNAHVQGDHSDAFHKHTWNPMTGREYPCEHIGCWNWPILSEVIEELDGWRQANHHTLIASINS